MDNLKLVGWGYSPPAYRTGTNYKKPFHWDPQCGWAQRYLEQLMEIELWVSEEGKYHVFDTDIDKWVMPRVCEVCSRTRQMALANTEWMKSGLCADAEENIWFPEQGHAEQAAAAAAVCVQCPVRAECEQNARDTRMEYGVWGGFQWNGKYWRDLRASA